MNSRENRGNRGSREIYGKGGQKYFCYHSGSVMDVLAVGVCIIAMMVLMMAFLGSSQLLDQKAQISQTARKYILKMETVGYLTLNDSLALTQELKELGAQEVDLTGSTVNEVSYGNPIYLVIRGKINGQSTNVGGSLFQTIFGTTAYEFEDRKVSTAKN